MNLPRSFVSLIKASRWAAGESERNLEIYPCKFVRLGGAVIDEAGGATGGGIATPGAEGGRTPATGGCIAG